MSQIHKRFTSDQVKELLEHKKKREIERWKNDRERFLKAKLHGRSYC